MGKPSSYITQTLGIICKKSWGGRRRVNPHTCISCHWKLYAIECLLFDGWNDYFELQMTITTLKAVVFVRVKVAYLFVSAYHIIIESWMATRNSLIRCPPPVCFKYPRWMGTWNSHFSWFDCRKGNELERLVLPQGEQPIDHRQAHNSDSTGVGF